MRSSRWFMALGALLGTALYHHFHTYFWEAIRALLYEKGWHMLSEWLGSPPTDVLIHYGITTALLAFGLIALYPARPNFLRRKPIRIFLERETQSDLMGIQTFSHCRAG